MTTALDKPLRRELLIDERPYTLTIEPDGLKLVEKGRRNGIALAWRDLVNGRRRIGRGPAGIGGAAVNPGKRDVDHV